VFYGRHWDELGYLIIYVTARPDMQQRMVVGWLARHNFPHGMVAFMDGLSADPLRQKTNYLRNLVQEVRSTATATKVFHCRIFLDFVFIFQIYNAKLSTETVISSTLMIILCFVFFNCFCAKTAPDRKFTTSSPWRWPSPSGRKAVIGRYPI